MTPPRTTLCHGGLMCGMPATLLTRIGLRVLSKVMPGRRGLNRRADGTCGGPQPAEFGVLLDGGLIAAVSMDPNTTLFVRHSYQQDLSRSQY